VLPARLTTARGILWLPPSSTSTPNGRKGTGSTAKFTMDGDGDEGFSELEAVDGVGSDLLKRRTSSGCRGKKIQKPVWLQQRNWDAGTEAIASAEVTSSTKATAIEYDRWAYGTNV
jgi:hypothetical protein